jgi:hypothetical protein
MEIGEDVTVPFTKMVEAELKCKAPPETTDWKAKINQWGSRQNCSGTALYKNMEQDKDKEQGFLAPPKAFVAKPAPGTKWKLADVTPEKFPVQAHHLIPKNHLPDHAVCTFLAKNYTESKQYQLTADAPYSTDHANNGYCLPYATPLAEWKALGKDADAEPWKLNLCFDVIMQTRRQLHQGSHRVEPYDSVPDDEEAGIHETGYLQAVDELLTVVQRAASKHVDQCEICKPGEHKEGKAQVLPRKQIVVQMDQVSGIVKLLIDFNRAFISEPSSLFGEQILGKRGRIDLPPSLGGSAAGGGG